MMNDFPPAILFLMGAIFVPLFQGRVKNYYVILIPILGFFLVSKLSIGESWHLSFLGHQLTLLRVDKLSKAFGYIFCLNAFAAFVYAFYLKDSSQHVAALLYIGCSLGVVFSGDLITLYLFWEGMAVASTFLILARRTSKAQGAAYRYVLFHIVGGLCLLAGIVLHITQHDTIIFQPGFQPALSTYLILIGFLVNAAAPPFSAWLSDAYPEATVTGGVILSAYTTKTAVYTLIRGFPGWEILIIIGCIMTIYGSIYALLENDIRRILAYSIITKVGFMVTGIGIGTAMSINGTVAYAFCHIIYKALLWMSAGSVLYMTGKSKCTDLGGLYKTMPWTLLFGLVGALSISFPGTSGFTSKSLIIEGAMYQHLFWPWLVLEIASAGVFLYAGIKLPYFVFFAKDQGLRPGEAPKTMLYAMAFMSFICLFLGIYPYPLYNILPNPVDYHAYEINHVISQLQLLMFSALVFFLFLPLLKKTETISLDTDWFYRKGGRAIYWALDKGLNGLNRIFARVFFETLAPFLAHLSKDLIARAILLLFVPVWLAKGFQGPRLDFRKQAYYWSLLKGAVPIGVGVAATTVILIIIFLFR